MVLINVGVIKIKKIQQMAAKVKRVGNNAAKRHICNTAFTAIPPCLTAFGVKTKKNMMS